MALKSTFEKIDDFMKRPLDAPPETSLLVVPLRDQRQFAGHFDGPADQMPQRYQQQRTRRDAQISQLALLAHQRHQ